MQSNFRKVIYEVVAKTPRATPTTSGAEVFNTQPDPEHACRYNAADHDPPRLA